MPWKEHGLNAQRKLHLVTSEQPRLMVIDTETGEQIGPLDDYLASYENDIRRLKARLTSLQANREAEARKHKLWAEAETAHDWWRIACGHPGVKFGAEEFYQALPRLKERNGLMLLLKAIAGAAYDPNTKRMKNGSTMRYDDWELICRSKAKAENFARRVYGGAESEQWKGWLVQQIESNLQGKAK